MNPYLVAFREYGRCDREVIWTDALDYHLQLGAVISTATSFVMARPVAMAWPDEMHARLIDCDDAIHDCWHVWVVAGDLSELLRLAEGYGVEWLSYQRHGQERVRRVRLVHLFKKGTRSGRLSCAHEVPENAETSSGSCCGSCSSSCVSDRLGLVERGR